jgi:hypothetical protein
MRMAVAAFGIESILTIDSGCRPVFCGLDGRALVPVAVLRG